MNFKIGNTSAQRIINRIIQSYRPKKIILFGSFARGDVHQGSDLDLIIIKNTKQKFLRRMDAVLDLCDGEIAVEPLIYTEAEFKKMLEEGNNFLETVFQGEKWYMKEGLAKETYFKNNEAFS